jgi:negative regulator of flagellin synthesis FlgM
VKIDTTVKTVTPSRGKDTKAGNSRVAAASSGSASVSDDVRLTSTSGQLRQLEAQLAEVDITDSGKIEEIRQAIADGSFVVDDEAVAEGLIQESIDNITHQPQQ